MALRMGLKTVTVNCSYVINNGSDGANKALNNLESKFGGAIGYRLMYADTVDTLIRVYTEENEYTGPQLY